MSSPVQVLELVGGQKITQIPVKDAYDLIRLVRQGLPTRAVDLLLAEGRLTLGELDRLVLPRKTLYHRRKLGRLTPQQSDRLLRVVRLLALAEETFGSDDKAHAWLRRSTGALADERPLDLLDTEEGIRAVEVLLGRIAHGIAA
jgi:putative toxin-antitoxin system antitoxin component (TIGR02293 family)